LLGGRLDITPFDGVFDFDSTTKKEILYGEYNHDATLVYDEEARSSSYGDGHDCFHALSDKDAIPLDIAKSESEGGLVIKKEETYTLTDLEHDETTTKIGHPLAYCPIGVPTRVILTVYVEGWDYDAIEKASYGAFDLTLSFSAFNMPKGA
jgi:hypothetical protein